MKIIKKNLIKKYHKYYKIMILVVIVNKIVNPIVKLIKNNNK